MRYGYEYDRNGNRHSERIESYDSGVGQSWLVSSSTGYDYNALDQLLASTPNSGDATAYVWDALGRVATETTGDKVQTFGWSADDHLLSVSHATNAAADWSVAYAYDHRGERVSRTDGADATRYLSDDENPTGYSQALAEVSADATTTKANYWYADSFGPLAEAHNPGSPEFSLSFLHGDHLSTTRGLTAATTGAFSQIDYAPFGSITSGGGSLTTQYAFTGQWRDVRSGLQHHRARWLDCGLGMWASRDIEFDWPSNFGNAHSYCGALPASAADISGTFEMVDVLSALAIISNLVAIALPVANGVYGISLIREQFVTPGLLLSYLPTAVIFGIEGGMSQRFRGSAGIGWVAGLETLWIPRQGFLSGMETYAFYGASLQPQTTTTAGFFCLKAGFVWNIANAMDYTELYATSTFGSVYAIHLMLLTLFLNAAYADRDNALDVGAIFTAYVVLADIINYIASSLAMFNLSASFFYSPSFFQGSVRRSFGFTINISPTHSLSKSYGASMAYYKRLTQEVRFWSSFVARVRARSQANLDTGLPQLSQIMKDAVPEMDYLEGRRP